MQAERHWGEPALLPPAPEPLSHWTVGLTALGACVRFEEAAPGSLQVG